MHAPPRLRLFQYYAIEAANAFASTLFLHCMYFWNRSRFGFTDGENLLLGAVYGLTFVIASFYGGRLGDRIGYDRAMALSLVGTGCIPLLGWLLPWHATPFLVVVPYTACLALTWPALEAAIVHTPAALPMPDRLTLYSMVWALGGACGFFTSGFLFEWKPDSILWAAGGIHLTLLIWLLQNRSVPVQEGETAMEVPHRGDDIPRDAKRRFMHTAWLANALAYAMNSSFAALVPQMGDRLGLAPSAAIWLACTILFARGFGFFLFWRWPAWHYHMGWSLAAIWLAPACIALAFFAPIPALVFVALLLFGVTLSLSYSGSIYYSLDYGEKKGEHGGLHEAILGIGICLGPLTGAFASKVGGSTAGAQAAIVLLVLAATTVGLLIVRRINPPKPA